MIENALFLIIVLAALAAGGCLVETCGTLFDAANQTSADLGETDARTERAA